LDDIIAKWNPEIKLMKDIKKEFWLKM
jgi:hypothetical protein